jgi:hypothetical protein
MGLLDDALSTADSLLGDDGGAGGKTKADPPPDYERGSPLADEDAGGAAGTNEHANAMDLAPIEFVHYGHVHAADGSAFVHDLIDDRKGEAEIEEDDVGRAVPFRAAIHRETLLLHEFVKSTQATLTDYNSSQGPLGAVAGAAMDLITGDEPEAQPPDPAELDDHVKEISEAGGLVNKEDVKWLDVFTAGKDLHQYRADHALFCENAKKHFIEKEGGGGEGLGGLLPEMPGVSDGIKLVQSILFKAYDIYLAMYLLFREEFEDDIVDACYELSIKAVKERWRPVYPIWFPQPPPPPPPGGGPPGPTNPIEEAIEAAKKAKDKVEKKVDGVVQDVKDFLGFEDDPPDAPGRDVVEALFSKFSGDPDALAQPTASSVFVTAFREAIGLDSLPEIIETVIAEITAANLGLLRRVFHGIITTRGQMPIDVNAMSRAGRDELSHKFFEIAGRLIPGLGFLNDGTNLFKAGDTKFGGEQIKHFGADKVDGLMGSQLGTIAELSSAKLAPILETARTTAGDDGITMELLVGQFPMLLSLQFRNTFFPLVDLVMGAVFGAIAGPMSNAIAPVRGFLTGAMGDVSDAYKDAKEVYDTVNAAKDKLASGVSAADIAKDPEGFLDDLTGGGAAPGGGPPPPPPFPGNDRVPTGKGQEVTAAEADEADPLIEEMNIVT